MIFRQDVKAWACLQLQDGLRVAGLGVHWAGLRCTAQRNRGTSRVKRSGDVIAAHPAKGVANAHLIPGPCGTLTGFACKVHGNIGGIYAQAFRFAGRFLSEVGSPCVDDITSSGCALGNCVGKRLCSLTGNREFGYAAYVVKIERVRAGIILRAYAAGEIQRAMVVHDAHIAGFVDVPIYTIADHSRS